MIQLQSAISALRGTKCTKPCHFVGFRTDPGAFWRRVCCWSLERSPGTVSHATCWVNGWLEGGHWNEAGREQRAVAVGSGSWGRVRVTKHGICTLQFQRKGQAHCMWGYACICIRRIRRMWDPALVCNPVRDLSPADNPVSMVGVRVCIVDVMFDWLITASWEKCWGSAWNYSKCFFFFFCTCLALGI